MDDRDAEDARLLADGRHAELLAAYYPVIRDRVRLRVPAGDVDEVAHRVVERLLDELARGRGHTYRVPYRVVVHKVIGWTRAEHFGETRPGELSFDPPDPGDPVGEVEGHVAMAQMFAALPGRQREVLEMRYLGGCEIAEIAERLGMTRNAVDQALFRGHATLRGTLHG